MTQIAAPVAGALFGMFLQDVRDIEKRNPQLFENKYYRFSFRESSTDSFELLIDPHTLPSGIEGEIKSSFDARLNRVAKPFTIKTLLVATDFSNASKSAARYGVEMADAFRGRVVLFNAYPSGVITLVDTVAFVETEERKRTVQEELEAEADRLTGERAVPIELLSKEGPSTEAILEAAMEVKADLIVAGLKGGGRAIRRMFGSTVTALAAQTSIPLLIVPEGTHFSRPKAIALANDIMPDADDHLLDVLHVIAERAHAKFYVVRVVRGKSGEVAEILHWPGSLEGKVRDLDPVYEYPVDKNVAQALADFIPEHDIDLLVMVPHRHSFLEKIWRPGVTKRVIRRAKIPLLILPGPGR